MAVQEWIYTVLNYFHKDGRFNRVTLGLSSKSSLILRWRFTDVVLVLILIVAYSATYYIQPFERQFYINDLTISHPFAEVERVSNTYLFLYAVWVPGMLITVLSLIFTKPKNKVYNTYIALLGLGISVLSTSVLTDVLKNFIGRHRPDFLSRCIPKEGTPENVLVFAKDVCTTKNLERLRDGFRTTPSGHSSLSFAGLYYLSLWLAGQLVITNEYVGSWRSVVSFLPSLGAALIALSRTEDYRHHFVDILIGSIIGITIGYISYFRLFPEISHAKSYNPILVNNEEHDEMEEVTYNRIDAEV